MRKIYKIVSDATHLLHHRKKIALFGGLCGGGEQICVINFLNQCIVLSVTMKYR